MSLEPRLGLEAQAVRKAIQKELGDEVAGCRKVVKQLEVLANDRGECPAAAQLMLADLVVFKKRKGLLVMFLYIGELSVCITYFESFEAITTGFNGARLVTYCLEAIIHA